ncbi:hypothetical protein [Paractinoplanes maris]|uniref:hypothetical protein n=1 Tax=Paractinoplanes maris TaxID=1734446 RepID=UPI002021E82C|nr:hypothetical protein [Actinoplanes maris]
MSWHLQSDTIGAYATGRLGVASAGSVEAHLLECGMCRAKLAGLAQSEAPARRRHDDSLAVILDQIDRPQPTLLERFLTALGVSPGLAKLTAGAPRLRQSWLVGGLAVLAVAVLVAQVGPGPAGVVMFVVSAPVAPALGIAFSYGWGGDPAGEIAVTAPLPVLRLLLLRTVVVLLSWLPVAALLAVALPERGRVALLWFIPAIALTSLTVALASFVGTARAATAVTTTWLVLAATTVRGTRWTTASAWLEHSFLFRPIGQALLAVIALGALVVAIARRTSFEVRRSS